MQMTTTTFRHFSSAVQLRQVGKYGVIEIRNTGPLLQETYERFGPLVLEHIKDAPAAVVRFDTALHMILQPPKWGSAQYHPASPPQAIVVLDQHYAIWLQHADNLRSRWGVTRTVWTTDQKAQAYLWADQMAILSPRRRIAQESGPAPLTE